MNDPVRYQVADLIVDAGRGRVMREGNELPLPKLSFELLLVLIRAAPNLLSLDTLMEKVWAGLVVSPETVVQRVKLLRDALGDDPKAPRYIAGLRGRGYQLIAPVQSVATEAPPAPDIAAESTTPPAAMPRAHRWRSALTFGTAAVLIAAAAAYAFLSYRASRFSPPPHSIAVLSFVNMSGDPSQEYFTDGLAEELSDALARINELQVAARTSSFTFKGKNVDIPTIARQLNVASVLEGSVRKAGDHVRITTQLINARTGFHLWSQTYEREIRDILGIQNEIAKAVSGALKITLLAGEEKQLSPGGTRNPGAYDAYLRGRYGESIEDEAGLRAALAALDEAIALDPQYAQALAFRADVVSQIANMYEKDPHERERLLAEARANVDKAVALAPNSALAFETLGVVLSAIGNDWKAIDAAYRHSVALEPGSAEILHSYASYAATFGRPDALTAAKRAVSLDPLDLGAHANLGVTLYYAHRFQEAAAAFAEAMRLGNNRVTINWMGLNALALGDASTALKYCERDLNFWYDQVCLAMTYHALGRHGDAENMLKRMMAAQSDGAAYQYAEVYAFWGDAANAMNWLTRAVELKDGGLMAIKTDPLLDSLRDNPEFKAVVERLNLPT